MKISILTQLKFGLLFPLFFVILLGIVSYSQNGVHYKKTETLYTNALTLERSLSMLKSFVISLHRDMKDISLDSTKREIDIELQWIKWWQLRASGQIDTIYRLYTGNQNDIDSLNDNLSVLNTICKNTIELMRAGEKSEVLNRTKTNGIISEKVEKLLARLNEISDLTIKKDDELYLELVKVGDIFNRRILLLILIVFLFSLFISFILIRNIAERKKVEEALQQSEDKFKYFFEHSPVGESLTLPEGEINVNQAFCNLLGYDPHELKNKKWQEITHSEDIELTQREIDKLLSGKNESARFIKRFLHKNGNIVWVDLSSSIRRTREGKPLYFMSSLIDITENKKAEVSLKESSVKLLQLNSDKDRFISILGHDLKNPFNNILGFSEILNEDLGRLQRYEIEEIARNINGSAQIINKLLEDILMWAKMQGGKISYKPQNLKIKDICDDAIKLLKQAADSKNISITCLSENHLEVYGDIDMLKTILRNLISNAIKFTNTGGAISIEAKPVNDYVTISVSDNGVGIPPENMAKLFDLSQVLTTKGTAAETGTGLGLLLCKEFIERHGGKILVESIVGKGSSFKFTMPKAVYLT